MVMAAHARACKAAGAISDHRFGIAVEAVENAPLSLGGSIEPGNGPVGADPVRTDVGLGVQFGLREFHAAKQSAEIHASL